MDRISLLETELVQARAQISRAEAMAHEDPLTGALNRRGFARELEKGMAFRNRYGTPASIILFDMDGLKTVNDRLGHAAGDAGCAGDRPHLFARLTRRSLCHFRPSRTQFTAIRDPAA
jgi:predicted signal transduction protein with EAL and GGDEF domain